MSDARRYAAFYLDRGWIPLPIAYREKGCLVPGWPDRTLDEARESFDRDFPEGEPRNVGCLLSGDVCDVDLDCPEAVELAPLILPQSLRFGRGGVVTHYIYASEARPLALVDPLDRSMLVETRAGRQQTIFPGSVHPSGEPIEFDRAGPTAIEPLDVEAVRLLAFCAAVKRHWPTSGARHDHRLAIAAILLRDAKLDPDRALRLLEAIDGSDPSDCAKAVESSARAEVVRTWGTFPVGERRAWRALLGADVEGAGEPHDDSGNGERFARLHVDSVRRVAGWGWRVWEGSHWRDDPEGLTVMHLTKSVSEDVLKEAAMLELAATAEADDEAREKIRERAERARKWAHVSRSEPSRRRVEALAKSEAEMRVGVDDLDRDPMLFNVSNGTIDLRSGELRPHDRADLITRVSPVAFDPSAPCPTWERFLERVLPDSETRAWVQRFAGYACTGDVGEQVIAFFFGAGANGKTTFLNALESVLGPYCVAAPASLLEASPFGAGDPTASLVLQGARLALGSETEAGRPWAESMVKRLTGGDRISARKLYVGHVDFAPTHKLIISGNHKPRIRGTDHGIWRRIRLVPFDVTIPDEERDPDLPKKLHAERSGILRWVVEGCAEWQRRGLGTAKQIDAATDAYRAESDLVALFVAERCEMGGSGEIPASMLLAEFSQWVKDAHGERVAMNQTLFGRSLDRLGLDKRKTGGKVVYRGIAWRGVGLGLRVVS